VLFIDTPSSALFILIYCRAQGLVDPFMDWEKMNMLTQKKIDTVPSKKKYHDGGGLYFYKSSHHTGSLV